MRWASLTVGFALLASPTFAQSLGGVRLGMSEAAAVEVIGGEAKPIKGNDFEKYIFNTDRTILARSCREKIISIQEYFGISLYDFTSEYELYKKTYGDPFFEVSEVRLRGSKRFSTIRASWVKNGITADVEISQNEIDGNILSVLRRLSSSVKCE